MDERKFVPGAKGEQWAARGVGGGGKGGGVTTGGRVVGRGGWGVVGGSVGEGTADGQLAAGHGRGGGCGLAAPCCQRLLPRGGEVWVAVGGWRVAGDGKRQRAGGSRRPPHSSSSRALPPCQQPPFP